jgi:hypothetical protein
MNESTNRLEVEWVPEFGAADTNRWNRTRDKQAHSQRFDRFDTVGTIVFRGIHLPTDAVEFELPLRFCERRGAVPSPPS